jgi:hypothetical protein
LVRAIGTLCHSNSQIRAANSRNSGKVPVY